MKTFIISTSPYHDDNGQLLGVNVLTTDEEMNQIGDSDEAATLDEAVADAVNLAYLHFQIHEDLDRVVIHRDGNEEKVIDRPDGAPNLDGTDADDLAEFAQASLEDWEAKSMELFGHSSSTDQEIIRSLGHYAAMKSAAMKLRASGQITQALNKEAICETIYDNLPQIAKW